MKLLHSWLSRVANLFRRRSLEREMEEEFRAHLELEQERQVARGVPPAEARRQARLAFGGIEQLKEREREARGVSWLETGLRDVRYGWRMLRKNPGFTTVAVLTLALGLSANITVFSTISFFFFKPLPVAHPDRLVVLSRQTAQFDLSLPLSWANFEDFRRDVQVFSDTAALLFRPVHLGRPGRAPDRTYLEAVSGNYFDLLGIQPLHGRLFLPGEGEAVGADPVAVLNHDYWQTKLGGDPSIVGETVMINAQPFRVIGVTPKAFASAQWAVLPSAYIPAKMAPVIFNDLQGAFEVREWTIFKVFASLAPGVTLDQAQAAVDVVHQRLVPEHRLPEEERQVRTLVRREMMSRPDPSVAHLVPFAAAVFMAMVILVLFIACANVANLMFSRAVARQREMGIRSALGASRGRLIRQLVTESLLVAFLAGAVGLVLSHWSGRLLERFAPSNGEMPLRQDAGWDWNTVWFTLAASFAAGLVMSIVPARRATDVDVQAAVKGAPTQARRRRQWFRHGLVITQVGFTVIVLVCGGLFVRSLGRMALIDLGFRPDRLLVASIDPQLNGYPEERARQLADELVERLEGLPEVEAATLATHVPLATTFDLREVGRAVDAPRATGDAAPEAQAGLNRVQPGYFTTMGVRLLAGRGFTRADTPESPPVAVINQALAERLWPEGNALGERILFDGVAREVVGIAATGKYLMLGETERPYVFVPLAQLFGGPLVLHVRSRGAPDALAAALRQVVRSADENLPVFNVLTMEEHLRTSAFGFMPLRMAASVAGVQGGLGLFLAVMGIYGVVAYSVTQRTREIGVRMALGAAPRDVLRLVIGGGFRLTALGLVGGLVIALGFAHVLAGLLYGLNPLDPLVFGGSTLLLVIVALAACYLPARRALRVDPMIALRAE